MSKSRREKVTEEIKNKLEMIDSILIETPDEMGSEEYEELIIEAIKARETLKFLERL